ncbi:MAG: hypothetical protein Kow0075_13380 [Salibacteraceae bacterium]
MFAEILKIAALVLFSSVKFLFAPSTVYLSGYNVWQTILITIIGGFLGVVVFYKGGSYIFAWWTRRFGGGKATKKFNRRTRTLVKIKNKYGLYGLAFLSPCLISIPIGAVVAAKYFRHDNRTIPVFFSAVVFWSITLTMLTHLIGPLFD